MSSKNRDQATVNADQRLTKTGTSLQTVATQLETSLSSSFQATRTFANEPGQAVEHFKQWKSGVGQLHDVIDRQLKFCKDLRQNHTLLSLYKDTESEEQRKHVNTLVTQMKVDIRSMVKRYPEARAIALPTLEVDDLEEQQLQEQYEHKMQEQHEREQYEQKNNAKESKTKTATTTTNEDNNEEEDDYLNRKTKIERTQQEVHTRRVNLLLKSIVLPSEGQTHLPMDALLSLTIARSQLIASVIESALGKKKTLYESFGVDLDVDTLRPSEAGEGREMHVLHDMIGSFRSVLETVSACMLMQSYGPVDSIRRLQAERDDLKHALVSTTTDLKLVQGDLIAEKNSKRGLMSGDETQGAASLQVQLRTEKRRCQGIVQDLQTQWNISARKDDEIQQLKEQIVRMKSEQTEASQLHQKKTELLIPHVERLESSVESIGRSYGKLETDVQLLSIMYKDALKDLEVSQRKERDVEQERDLMASKLTTLLKKLQLSRAEEKRKDLIARKTMIARRTALDSTALTRQEMAKVRLQETRARQEIESLQEQLVESTNNNSSYARQKSMLEEEINDLTTANFQNTKVIEKLTQDKLQMLSMHASEMKELVMRPTKDEVDVQLAELKGQLEEAIMTSEALKEALATSQLGN
jgi:hypothetical protein